jgi:hypothetical protein
MKLPTQVFDPKFAAESVHYDSEGKRTTKAFRSLRTLKLTARDFKSALKGFKPKAIMGRLKGLGKRYKGKMIGGAKGVAALIVVLALNYFLGKWMEKQTEEMLQKKIEALSPQVEEKLLEKEHELEALLEEDSEADFYINVRFAITTIEQTYPFGPDGPEEVETPPFPELDSVGYSRQPWDAKVFTKQEHACGAHAYSDIHTVSYPVSPAELFDPIDPKESEETPEPVPQ